MLAGRERALATVDLAAVRHNVGRLKSLLPPGGMLCAVVKANGYGHGAVAVAQAAQAAGAEWLGVATAGEAEELRAARLVGPLMIFGPLTGSELQRAVVADADVIVWSERFMTEAQKAGARLHVKFDSGMGRLGADAATAERLAAAAAASGQLAGLMSHFATADEADTSFFELQLERFLALSAKLKQSYPAMIAHAANSAATLRSPRSHCDMVRIGIAMYGLAPANDDPFKDDLRPAMRLGSYIADIRVVQAGDSVGYGRRFIAERETRIAIVPIGYADGVARSLTNRGTVLIDGHRCAIKGTISMDQLTVELPAAVGALGDEVVFIGASGSDRILAEEVAQMLDTINYEVVCDVGPRVVRRFVGAGPVA
jgi:alanine racemase